MPAQSIDHQVEGDRQASDLVVTVLPQAMLEVTFGNSARRFNQPRQWPADGAADVQPAQIAESDTHEESEDQHRQQLTGGAGR